MSAEPVAVVLGGGGARGAYQVGVWKALRELNVEIGGVYGVSVGAINGAVMAMDDYEMAERLWMHLEKANVMELSDSVKRVLSGDFSLTDLADAAGYLYENQGISTVPLEQLLRNNIDENKIRKGDIDYGLLTYSLSDFSEEQKYISDIPEGELVDYILASANLPVFQRKQINGTEYIDGGVYRNLPIDMVDWRKFSMVIVVSLDLYTLYDVFDYLTDFSEYRFEVIFIRPEKNPGSILDFNPENSKKLFNSGYNDCMKVLRGRDEL